MCGIAGVVRTDGCAVNVETVQQMTARLRHRGPDDEGYLLGMFPNGPVTSMAGNDTVPARRAVLPHVVGAASTPHSLVLGHRRLSIIDCTPGGHQPMADQSEHLWIVYNGEIYNYIELRAELEGKGHVFRTRSDTEVLLAAYWEWGPDCLRRFNGMWAFCLWDRRRGDLFCARDRFGVKPFYYFYDGATFAFASEIKALLVALTFSPAVDDAAAYDHLEFGLVEHTPETMMRGIVQLPPSHTLTLTGRGELQTRRYFTLSYTTDRRPYDEAGMTHLAARYRELFTDAVRLRLRTDVPLGSCLSGGLDSSSIVCAMSRLLAGPDGSTAQQRTFTAAYDQPGCDERRWVEAVVQATGVRATYTWPDAAGLWDELTTLTWHQDEPFGSTSMYAQWCVMRAARQGGVTVMLDGQGADELLGGYGFYYPIFLKELLRRGRLLTFQRELVAGASWSGHDPWRLAARCLAVFYDPIRRRLLPPRVRGLDLLVDDFARQHRARALRWHYAQPSADLQARLHDDMVHSLPQLLRHEDRNSMAFSIETRLPFLDVRLVEWAFAQPINVKLHDGWTKYLARRGIADLCPDTITWRDDKIGFATPEAQWVRAGMDVFLALTDPDTFHAGRFIDPHKLRAQLLPGGQVTPHWRRELWRAVSFELWMRVFGLS